MYEVTQKRQLGTACTLMKIKAPLVAKKALPGQFVIILPDEFGERIPLTIAASDGESGEVTVIFQQVGKTTKELGAIPEGGMVENIVGPLGTPSELEGIQRAVVVGGGVGCAIAWPQARWLFQHGANVDVIAGFRSKEIVILEEEMRATCTHLTITTDDGSYGTHGFVTDVLKELLQKDSSVELVIAIGPIPMMRAVAEVTRPLGVHTVVSLNPVMIDGTGMCGGCRVEVGGEMKFACVDGPDFDGHLVNFEELQKRNRFYGTQERERDGHPCRLLGGAHNG